MIKIKKKSIKIQNNQFVQIVILMVLAIIVQFLFPHADRVGDAYDYWERGRQISNSGKLDISAVDGFRGYVYPLFPGLCNFVGGDFAWRIVNSFVVGLFWGGIIPLFFEVKNTSLIKLFF